MAFAEETEKYASNIALLNKERGRGGGVKKSWLLLRMTFGEENEQFNTERNLLVTFRHENERHVTFTLEFHLFLDQRLKVEPNPAQEGWSSGKVGCLSITTNRSN